MTMKTWLMAVLLASVSLALVPTGADAKRLGGGRPAGMQRTVPDKPAQSAPATPAGNPNAPGTPANAAAPGATPPPAAAPTRSWLGPVAGLAAGLGLAALFSHLGMGEGFANIVMLALLAMVALVAIRWLMRRFASGASQAMPYAMAGAGSAGPGVGPNALAPSPRIEPRLESPDAPAATGTRLALPADFDVAAFERISKTIFIRLQTANDSADLNDLRAFTTPELFASLRVDLQERGAAAQQTDVVTLNAELIDFAQEGERQIVSVRFHGLIREEANTPAAPFDEVWHLVRPLDGSRSWAIAGIQPAAQDAALAA
jgi:predicted lipid-binding transport protein (Tim44 family)